MPYSTELKKRTCNIMKITIENTTTIKPISEATQAPKCAHYIPLSVFDKVTYNTHIAVIYAYRPPTPSFEAIRFGLQRALSEYRVWAGRLGENEKGEPVILLNDKGVKFIEATTEKKLDDVMPFKPSPILLNLHPSLEGVEELIQVQLTRFTCGSLVVGYTSNSDFLVAWERLPVGSTLIHFRSMIAPFLVLENLRVLSLSIEEWSLKAKF